MSPETGLPAAPSSVARVRSFNRFYTRQIGVLNEHLLEGPFSLTETRVLYELAHRPRSTASDLCRDLGLDPGYLSRMLRSFEKQELIARDESKADGRQSLVSLTQHGKKTFEPLEARSNQQVSALLGRLPPSHQKQLLNALHIIQKLLGPKLPSQPPYMLRPHHPGDMGWVVHRHGTLYWEEYKYDERFEALVAEIVAHFIQKFQPRRDACWIAERDGEIAGSIFLVKESKTVAKLRLLLVEPSARGLGIGKRLIAECVRFARQVGYKRIILWTQSELHAARHLYQQAGFKLVGKKRHNSWGRKGLIAETWELIL
jgi:DNA-binding MarR family transcriptional regulator/GNAT superfamily N-acetyltransferase